MDRFGLWKNTKTVKPMDLTFIGGKTERRHSKKTTEKEELTATGLVGMRMDKSNCNRP